MKFDQKQMELKLRQMADTQRNVFGALPGMHWLVSLLLVVALSVSGFTLFKLKMVISEGRTVSTVSPVSYKLNRDALTANEYQATLEWFRRLHPDVKFDLPKEGGVRVYITDGAAHPDWVQALASLQSRDQDVVWEADELCVGRCGGSAAQAFVKGYRQKIVSSEVKS